jgi:hypothetical protein
VNANFFTLVATPAPMPLSLNFCILTAGEATHSRVPLGLCFKMINAVSDHEAVFCCVFCSHLELAGVHTSNELEQLRTIRKNARPL